MKNELKLLRVMFCSGLKYAALLTRYAIQTRRKLGLRPCALPTAFFLQKAMDLFSKNLPEVQYSIYTVFFVTV